MIGFRNIACTVLIVAVVGTLLLYIGKRVARFDATYQAAEEYVSHNKQIGSQVGAIKKIGEHYRWDKKDSTAFVMLSVEGVQGNVRAHCFLKKKGEVWVIDSVNVEKVSKTIN